MKKSVALIAATLLLAGLTACGGSNAASDAPAKSDGTSKTETNKEEPKPQLDDLTGTWKQTNSNDPNSYMEATISGDTIEVNWIGTDTKSLYWKGTYQAPTKAGSGPARATPKPWLNPCSPRRTPPRTSPTAKPTA